MGTQVLDKETSDKMSFISFIIPAFAKAYQMNMQVAYRYLKQYGGIDFLQKKWLALHTDHEIWTVRDIYEVC